MLEAKFGRFDKPIAPVRPGMRVITGQELQENSLKSYKYLV